MTIELPSWLASVAEVAAGHFPEADEDALWRMRDAYTAAAQAVHGVAQDGEAVTQASMAAMLGQANLALDRYWTSFSTGHQAYLTQLEQLCTDLAQTCDAMALETEYVKLSVIAALVALAAQIVALIASAFATVGASAALVPVAMAGTRMIIMAILRQMIAEIITSVVTKVATTVGLQGIQILDGHRSLDQLDLGKVGDAIVGGAIDGAIGGFTKFGADKLGASVLGTAATRGQHAAVGATIGALSGAVDTQAGSLARGHGFASADQTAHGQLTGAVSGAKQGYDGHDEAHAPPASSGSRADPNGTPPVGSGGHPAPAPAGGQGAGSQHGAEDKGVEIPDLEATELEPEPMDAPEQDRPIPSLNLP